MKVINKAIMIYVSVYLIALLFPCFCFGNTNEAVLVDYGNTNIVTSSDSGLNDFSGNMGIINKDEIPYGAGKLICVSGNNCSQQLTWDFGSATDSYTGIFFSLFGLSDTRVTFDGSTVETLLFTEHVLDLDKVDGELQEPGGARSFNNLAILLKNGSPETVTVRVELKDSKGGMRYTRYSMTAGEEKTLLWDYRNLQSYWVDGIDLDIHSAKILSLMIERQHVVHNVYNPATGSIDIKRIWFEANRLETEPSTDALLLDQLKRRSAQYFLDWSSRKPESFGIPQDRSTFGDLLTVAGVGFALPAYIISSNNGWISKDAAAYMVLSVLENLDKEDSFGSEQKGKVGYQGWFYHFLDVHGNRKLNFDFTDTTSINEAMNTVEVSTIDTALALMGILASQSYFTGSDPVETNIRARAQNIYNRVVWHFMYNSPKRQFVHGWKPVEQRNADDFTVPDNNGLGHYSKGTWDYYTDEALIIALLAAGTAIDASDFYCSLNRVPDSNGLIRTYPGALFTYQFFHAFLNTNPSGTNGLPLINACPEEIPINWYENSRKAILTTKEYVESNPHNFSTYGPNAWGISAAQGPYGAYHAYGVPPVAIVNAPAVEGQNLEEPYQDGTVTYYGLVSSVSFGDDLKNKVIQALRAGWAKGHWHYRFALPDAFNDQINQVNADPQNSPLLLRTDGPWLQRALFAIDQGPMLLHLENQASGLIWSLLSRNPNIIKGVNTLNAPLQTVFEGEGGEGGRSIMTRSNASLGETKLLMSGDSLTFKFKTLGEKQYSIKIRYSNDNYGPLEVVSIFSDNVKVGEFNPQDTGDYGNGWDIFITSEAIGPVLVGPGDHTLTLKVEGGDGYGVEIDSVTLEVVKNEVTVNNTGSGGISCVPVSVLYGRSSRCVITPVSTPHPTYLDAFTDNGARVLDKVKDSVYSLGNVTSGHQLEAVFKVMPIRNSTTDMYFIQLQEACRSAVPDSILQLQAISFTENLVVSTNGCLSLMGGYDPSYVPTTNTSVIEGCLTVEKGMLAIDNIVIK